MGNSLGSCCPSERPGEVASFWLWLSPVLANEPERAFCSLYILGFPVKFILMTKIEICTYIFFKIIHFPQTFGRPFMGLQFEIVLVSEAMNTWNIRSLGHANQSHCLSKHLGINYIMCGTWETYWLFKQNTFSFGNSAPKYFSNVESSSNFLGRKCNTVRWPQESQGAWLISKC